MDETKQFVTVDTNLYQDPELIAIGHALPYIHLWELPYLFTELKPNRGSKYFKSRDFLGAVREQPNVTVYSGSTHLRHW